MEHRSSLRDSGARPTPAESDPTGSPPAAIDAHIVFVAVLDLEGRVLELSRGAAPAGQPVAGMGKSLWSLDIAAALGVELRAAVMRAARGEPSEFNAEAVVAGGRAAIGCSVRPVAGPTGAPLFLIAEAWEAPGPSWAIPELRMSHGKYAGIVSISADAIICTDESLRITDFNHGAEQIFGYTAAEVMGERLSMLLPERFRALHDEHMHAFGESAVAARRMGGRREVAGLRKGGEEFPADASISKLDSDGRRIFTVVLRDITALKRMETVQRFLARAGGLLAASLDVATTFDSVARLAASFIADCCVIFDASQMGVVRRAALASLDPRHEPVLNELRGRFVSEKSLHPVNRVLRDSEPLLVADVPALVASLADEDDDLRLFRALKVTSALFVPLVARGRTTGAIGLYRIASPHRFGAEDLAVAQDLAVPGALAVDNARLYEAARSAIRARDDVLAVVSHDLGNPLSAIRVGVSVLLRQAADAPANAGSDHLAGIKRSADQMQRLIRDLLDVKRLESGELSLDWHAVRPGTLVASVVEMFGSLAESRSIDLSTNVPASLPAMRADRERLQQVLSNLVGNALKFTPDGGRIEIRAEQRGESVVVSVMDTGQGIEEEHLEHMFDRFWRERRTGLHNEGLGLGLAIVAGIIQAHGGRVWAESQVGRGTTIRFTVPVMRSAVPG